MEYLGIANSFIMWVAVFPLVGLIVYQAFMFMRKAMKDGARMGVTKKQMNDAMKASFFASIGPCIVIVIGMVGLLSSLGGPLAWMRLSDIGSVMYELGAADRAATAAGSTLGTADMTMSAFANCVWVMIICTFGWIVVSALFTDKMGILRDKVAGGSGAVLSVISVAGGLGAMSFQCINRAYPVNAAAVPQIAAMLTGGILLFGFNTYADKKNAAWARQFGTTIAMIGGVCVGGFFL